MLKFNDISIAFNKKNILNNISFTANEGCITTIIGPNGCGKSTLISCLNESGHIVSGNVYLNDVDIKELKPKERAKKLAILPQIRNTIPALPSKVLVEHGRFPHLGFSRKKTKEDMRIVDEVMDFTNTTPYAHQYTDTLSGGVRQRVFFAMTLAQDCDIIVLDEPTTYLDIRSQQDFYRMLLTLREQNKTILIVLHDIAAALSISDKIIVMDNGHVLFDGNPKDCLRSHIIEDVFHTEIKTFSDKDGTYYVFT